jgi:DNA-binding NtrC family response regulator
MSCVFNISRVSSERATARALIVDPDAAFADGLAERLRPYAHVTTCTGFARARAQLRALEPQLLVTALALREYNGLHLVYLAGAAGLPTRSIVYTDQLDLGLATEIQAAGAFFELQHRLATTVAPYATARSLPPADRRIVTRPDRRHSPRGGRRVNDLQTASGV